MKQIYYLSYLLLFSLQVYGNTKLFIENDTKNSIKEITIKEKINIERYINRVVPTGNLRGKLGDSFDYLEEYTYEGPKIEYKSSNNSVVNINANKLEYVGFGSVIITAKSLETDEYLESEPVTFEVIVVDPSDPKMSYQGKGVFKLVTNEVDITNGYYVFVSETNAMSNVLDGNNLIKENIVIENNEILDPGRSIVWKIKDFLKDVDYQNDFFINSENLESYLYGDNNNYGGFSFINTTLNGFSLWKLNIENGILKGINTSYTNNEILYDNINEHFIINRTNEDLNFKIDNYKNLQLYKLIDSSLNTVDKNFIKDDIKIYKKDENNIGVKSENSKIKSIKIYDTSGKLILTLNKINQFFFETNKLLKKGVYIFVLQLENGNIITQKYLK